MAFIPKLDALATPQRSLWPALGATPQTFTLYGGTALAVDLTMLPTLTPCLPAPRRKLAQAMKALPETPELLAVAERVVWFKPPSEALADTMHFLAHAMTYGTVEDLLALKGLVGPDNFGGSA